LIIENFYFVFIAFNFSLILLLLLRWRRSGALEFIQALYLPLHLRVIARHEAICSFLKPVYSSEEDLILLLLLQ
jgi:hypothetical protein